MYIEITKVHQRVNFIYNQFVFVWHACHGWCSMQVQANLYTKEVRLLTSYSILVGLYDMDLVWWPLLV